MAKAVEQYRHKKDRETMWSETAVKNENRVIKRQGAFLKSECV